MAYGNKVSGKRQISTYLPEDVYEALLLRAAREKTNRSVIIERALRKELGLMWDTLESTRTAGIALQGGE